MSWWENSRKWYCEQSGEFATYDARERVGMVDNKTRRVGHLAMFLP